MKLEHSLSARNLLFQNKLIKEPKIIEKDINDDSKNNDKKEEKQEKEEKTKIEVKNEKKEIKKIEERKEIKKNDEKKIIKKEVKKEIKNIEEKKEIKKNEEKIEIKLIKIKKEKSIQSKILRFYNLFRLKILRLFINQNKIYIKEIKHKSLYLKRKNLTLLKFQKSMYNSLNLVKLDVGYLKIKKHLILNKFTQLLKHIISKLSVKFLLNKIKKFKKNLIKIQNNIRKYYSKKKYKKLKEIYINKIIKIQKRIKGIFIRQKYKNELFNIKDIIRFNKKKREFEKKMKLFKKKKEAVSIIEKYWLKILQKREEMDLEERLKNIPEEFRDLYKNIIQLRKDTKILKKDVIEYGEKEKEKRLKLMSTKKLEDKPIYKFK